MYDYEVEKSLEERQAEDLEINLERNKRNRKFAKKMKITYIIIVAIIILFAIVGFNRLQNNKAYLFFIYITIALVISFIILLIVKICPHCNTGLYKVTSYISDEYNLLEFIWTDRCPHCGLKLYPSESLTAIEERRKIGKLENNQDSK